jgi:hypothetical protein
LEHQGVREEVILCEVAAVVVLVMEDQLYILALLLAAMELVFHPCLQVSLIIIGQLQLEII